MNVEALNCPNCGSGVPSDAAYCEFCKSRLKTVGCRSCLGLMFVGSNYCGHCGAIAAPVMALEGEKIGDCPRCHSDLEKIALEDTRFAACKSCDGVWMNVDEFESVCAERERQSAVLGYFADRNQAAQQLTKVNYVPCPTCGQLMNRNNFAKASGVIVDLCKRHGVWLDADELPAIIEFIRKGGMELSRQRELNAIAQERDKLRDEQQQARIDQSRRGIFGDDASTRSFIRDLFDI